VDINTARVSQHSIRSRRSGISSGDSCPSVEPDGAQISGDVTVGVGDYQCVVVYRGGITSNCCTVDCTHDSGQIGTTVAIKGDLSTTHSDGGSASHGLEGTAGGYRT